MTAFSRAESENVFPGRQLHAFRVRGIEDDDDDDDDSAATDDDIDDDDICCCC